MKIALNGYSKILAQVQKEIQKTEQKIVQTVGRQKVEMCWQIGKIIDQHLLKNDRADYGNHFFTQLAEDTKIAEKALYQMRGFFKAYPKLPKDEKGLSWSHYRNLASIKDEEQRKQLEDLTLTENLDSDELRRRIKKSKPGVRKIEKLRVTRGKLFTYRKTKEGEIDLGFYTYLSPQPAVILDAQRRGSREVSGKTPEILESLRDSRMTVVRSGTKPEFTYLAKLEKIVDGDTIHVKLDLGFGVKHHEILRLAKIDAAKADVTEGEKATEELKKILKDLPFLILRTNKTDTYGRYIADVFIPEKKSDSPEKVAAEGVYLNQLLLDRGLVELYKGV